MRLRARVRPLLIVPALLSAVFAGGAVRRAQDMCGPFTDVSALFCPYVLEAYYTGITAGTSPTTFSPDMPITRGQAAVFAAKGLNQALARGSRRAALGQWWTTTPHYDAGLGFTSLDAFVGQPCSDGADIWVPTEQNGIWRIRASDGQVLGKWTTSPGGAEAALCAMGKVFGIGIGGLFMIDPTSAPGPATLVTANLGLGPRSIAFDGNRIWTANEVGMTVIEPYPPGSLSIVTPGTWAVETIITGARYPHGAVFDGTSMWMTDGVGAALLRLDSAGGIAQVVPTGNGPGFPAFDGTNIWVPNRDSSSVTIVRASTGDVVATLTGNGLFRPASAAFDGSRVLVADEGATVSLWNAQDLSPIGNSMTLPYGAAAAASDGINFWLTLSDFSSAGGLGRF